MSSPLPLRLCCMAAMAPALTEAATQAHIRLSSSPTVSPIDTSVNGRECIGLTPTRSNRSQGSGFKGDVSLGQKGFITLPTTCHKNGGLTFKSPFTQLSSKAKVNLASLGVISSLPDLCDEKEILKFTKNNGNCHHKNILNTMNQANRSKDDKVPSIQCEDCGTENDAQTTNKEKILCPVNAPQRSNGLHGGSDHQSSLSKLKLLRTVRNDCEKASQICSLPTQRGALRDNDCTGCESQPVVNNGDNLVHAVDSGRSTAQDCQKTQIHLERRLEYLKRRLRRLQSKQIQVHTHHQLNNYVTYQNGNLKVLSNSSAEQTVSPESVKPDIWQAEDVKNLSTVALVSLVKKIQTSQSLGLKPSPIVHKFEPRTVLHQDIERCLQSEKTVCEITSYIQHVEGAFDSDATASSSGGESADESVHLQEKERKNRLAFTPLHRRPEWKWAVDRAGIASRWTWLQAQVSDLEYRIRQQSDIYRQIRANKGTVVLGEQPAPEDLMAKSRLAARPGKRLSPLEAKIANIEKKNEMSPCNISTLLCNVDKQSSKLAQSLGNCLSPSPVNSPLSNNNRLKGSPHARSINGFVDRNSDGSDLDSPDSSVNRTPDPLRLKDSHELTVSPAVDVSCQAARCRPVKSYRKRKLLRTVGTHTNRKAIRLCSVKCQCYPPVTACAMCGGRYNSTRKINPHTMHTQEKISLLDTSTHPILSFPQDTPLPIHLEGTLSSEEWQAKLSPKAKLNDRRQAKMPSLNEHSRKTKRYARGVGLLTSTKYRRKIDTISRPRNRSASMPTTPRKRVERRKSHTAVKRRRAAQLAIALKRPYRSQSMSVMSSRASSGSGSRTPTPSPQAKNGVLNSMSATFREMKESALRKKRIESAYDIDNIVIPYSMAASTRVTKLKYKEIVTPKWRDLLDPESEDIPMDTSTVLEEPEHQPDETGDGPPLDESTPLTEEEEEIEDCSDEAFTQRHMKCEGQEKKRFMSFVQYGRRVRGSRTESESNTPDHLCTDGVPVDGLLPVGSVLLSDPPTTPSDTPTTPSSKFFTPIPVREGRESKDNGMRRRSSSVSYRDRSGSIDDSASQGSHLEMDMVYVDPWELRSFPLEEEDYDKILAEQPSVEELKKLVVEETAKTLMAAPLSTGVIINSRSSSPAPSTSTSMSEEDPNDPEWTLQCNNPQAHPSVV